MLSKAAARALRPAAAAARNSLKPSTAARTLSSTAAARSGGHGPEPPKIYGPGHKEGEVPTLFEQATGIERLQLLGDLQEVDVFDNAPLDASRLGTKADPILVPSLDKERIIGCTGFPADSHDVLWFPLTSDKLGRCYECGSVYKLNYVAAEHAHGHGHGHH